VPDIGLGQNCEIRNAIVDKNARIGHSVRLVNRNGVSAETAETLFHRRRHHRHPQGRRHPDGTVI